MKAAIACAIAALALSATGALAAIPSTTAYFYATQPMLSGTVAWVNEHQMAVRTDQNEDVVLGLDSHTMVPVDLAPGMPMRVQFRVMDDGRKYAKRIIPIRDGENANRELAYTQEVAGGANEAEYASSSDGRDNANGPVTASTALSATNQPLGTSMVASPATDAAHVALEPMIAGRVVTVNDHRIIVDTDQGQRVALEMDSRTLVPVDLASGMTVRVDYLALENGPKYATQITPIESKGIPSRELSYMSTPERHEAVEEKPAAYVAPAKTEPVARAQAKSDEPETLPQTASRQPLIALLGFLALGGAAVLAFGRRHFTA